MADADAPRPDPLHDVINLLAAPLASGIRSYEQFRSGIDELLRTIENLNATMENLNETAERVNRLLGDIEEPIRTIVPQISRIVGSPAVMALPHRLEELTEVLGDASRRLAPLAQLAESAGGMFGLRIPGLGGGSPASAPVEAPEPQMPEPQMPEPQMRAEGTKRAAKKAAPKKRAVTKKASTKKASSSRRATGG